MCKKYEYPVVMTDEDVNQMVYEIEREGGMKETFGLYNDSPYGGNRPPSVRPEDVIYRAMARYRGET